MVSKKRILIKVNGKPVELNNFSQSIFGNTIEAMVLSLKLEEKPEKIEIILTR